MENEPYDYRQYDQIWRRVAPQENPYPEVRRAGMAPRTSGSSATPSGRAPTPRDGSNQMMPGMMPGGSGEAMRALLREELRHMTQVLHLLENGLA